MTLNPVSRHREHCRDVRELMSEYLDGELDRRAAAGVRRHARWCPNCRRMMRNLRAVISALQMFGEQCTAAVRTHGRW